MEKKGKDLSLTFIQIVCAIAVVTLHTNGCFWQFSSTERYWRTANVIECLFYFAVPIFFMITGITLLDYTERYSTKEYFKKRISKVVIPYIAWSLIGLIFRLGTGRLSINSISFKWIMKGLLSTDGIVDLYWFFQPLFCVYMTIPLFALINKENKKKAADYILTVGFIINTLIPFLKNTLNLDFSWPYSISAISGYLFWIWGGYRIYYYPPTRKGKAIIYLFSIIGLSMHIIGTYTLSMWAGSIQSLYKGYNNVPCILYSFGAFILLRDIGTWLQKNIKVKKIILFLGEYTFPCYLIHWFILRINEYIIHVETKNILYRLLAPYAIYALVIGITMCIRKIPIFKKIVP